MGGAYVVGDDRSLLDFGSAPFRGGLPTTEAVKSRLAYWGVRAASGFMRIWPLWVVQPLGGAAGVVASLLLPRRRRMAGRHAGRTGLEEKSGSRSRAVRKMFASYGQYWGESLWAAPRNVRRMAGRFDLDGFEVLENALDDGKGVVVVLPHLGNWEMAGAAVWDMDVEVVAVAENLANSYIRDWFSRMRGLTGISVVFARRGILGELEKKLDSRTAVCLPSDRDLSGRGIPVQFFGEETTLPAGALLLGIRSGRPVVPAAVYFEKKSRYRAVLRPPLAIPREGSLSERLSKGAQLMACAFEDLIKAAPEQWHLLQPNWPSDRV
ncbi:MAG: hypothetical protein F4Z79_10815 [Acidimicrobiia bacterium]|nr:hypothetical protein [Acidimicrobiia bacterium]MXY74088.1 hypothetical protein [Acidimicrobiia bacterium]MYB79364.1 hypothetical protein [Acidimicrobiia bacterium]MYG91828.1 hypothetical protein [Acidimicrobiia bacterium]